MNIGVIICTYNRIEKLKIALETFDSQSLQPKYILIVNNKSTDGTKEYLEEWKKTKKEYEKYVINAEENWDGSGGFYIGEEEAIKLDADWIWISDDDAYPDKDALKNASIFLENYTNLDELAAICGKVINNGRIDCEHRKRIAKKIFKVNICPVLEKEYEKKSFEIDLFSYVGTIINKKYLLKYGLVNKDFFIYYDDTEHSYRLSKNGKILCVPSIMVTHDVMANKINESAWRSYYIVRNRLIFLKTIEKRFYIFESLKYRFKLGLKRILNYKVSTQKAIKTALYDAKNNKLGKHEIYRP